jgi:parallel beta-helix repeat protein
MLGGGLLVTAAPAASAAPVPVTCGESISFSVTLSNNIGPCVGSDGLDVTASNITINLNGHTIQGNSVHNDTNNEYLGINLTNVSGVTVTGPGVVEGFDAGVSITGGSGNKVENLTAQNNIAHVLYTGSGFTGQTGLYARANCNFGDGITTYNTHDDTITSNTATGNGPFSGISLVGNSRYIDVTKNHTYSNTVFNVEGSPSGSSVPGNFSGISGPCGPFSAAANGPGRPDQDIGLRVEGPGAQHNTVSMNTSDGNLLEGIAIHGNVCPGVVPNVTFPPNVHNVVSFNTVFGNGFDPDGAHDGIGILSQGPTGTVCIASDNTLTNNNIYSNGNDGIFVGGRGSGGNVITNNKANNNIHYGIELTGPSSSTKCGPTASTGSPLPAPNLYDCGTTGNRLSGNVAHGNNGGFDGFDGNPDCGNPTTQGAPANQNIWTGDSFVNVNQLVSPTCIH